MLSWLFPSTIKNSINYANDSDNNSYDSRSEEKETIAQEAEGHGEVFINVDTSLESHIQPNYSLTRMNVASGSEISPLTDISEECKTPLIEHCKSPVQVESPTIIETIQHSSPSTEVNIQQQYSSSNDDLIVIVYNLGFLSRIFAFCSFIVSFLRHDRNYED